MPICRALILMRGVQHAALGKIIANHVQSDRPVAIAKAARYRHRWQARQVGGNGVNVIQIHLDRIIRFFADVERDRRRSRAEDDVAALEREREILRDQPAQLLCFQVVRVVVAVRQNIGANQNAALDLGAEAFGARFFVHVLQVGVLGRTVAVAHTVEA